MTGAAMVAGRMLTGEAAVVAAGVQAVTSGVVLWAGSGQRWAGALFGAVLLAGVLAGSMRSGWAARETPAGLAHAMIYGTILVLFGRSLLPGRCAVVTQIAQRLNRRFRAGMVPYTRAVTLAWCGFAAVQLGTSALWLAAGWWEAWTLLVGGGHAVLLLLAAAVEFAVRHRRFPGEHTGFWATIRGIRRQGSGRPGRNSGHRSR